MTASLASMEDLHSTFERIIRFSSENLINFVPPKDLEKKLEEMLVNSQNSIEDIEKKVEFVLHHCVNTSHQLFVNQLYGGPNPIGLAAAFLVEKMNTNQHTYEAAPIFVLTERIILRHVRKLFFGSENGDGIFCPGGSFANMYGLIMARHNKYPDIKETGFFHLPPMLVFVSEDAHYSASKMANWMGLGQQNVIKVKTRKNGSMIVTDLELAIEKCKAEGKVPLAIIATIGTTVLGAFDNLDEISKVSRRESIWLHCDAAWGGAFIFSEKLRSKWLQGIEKCDSILWNAHKMLGAPLQCTVFITKKPNLLASCNRVSAPYLFQSNKHYDEEYDDTGDKSVQCGRKADAFKLWLMWSTMGLQSFCQIIEHTEDCARYFTDKIRSKDGFMLYLEEHQCTNVFFWYVPSKMRKQEKTESWWKEIGQITVKIRTELLLRNILIVGYAPLPQKNVSNALRLVLTAHPLKNYSDMNFIIQSIEDIGNDL